MSYHWENTIWQSKDGSWNRGFYHRISAAGSPGSWNDGDYDSEWDDEFDESYFDYARTGFRSEHDALLWEPAGNPGSASILSYRGNSKECKELDQLAFFHAHPEEKVKHDRKEFLRKNREHFKALHAEWTPEKIRAIGRFDTVIASVKGDDEAYSRLGMNYDLRGVPTIEGDWFKLEGKQIYNLKTDKFHKRVHSFGRPAPVQRAVYGRYGW